MENTYQFRNQNVLEHGYSVSNQYKNIIHNLNSRFQIQECLPLLSDNWELFSQYVYCWEDINISLIYHDCGKPLCHIQDDNGKSHFPNHAEISAKLFKDIVLKNVPRETSIADDELVKFVKNDMFYHNSPMSVIREVLSKIDDSCLSFYCTLWVIAYSEILANKQMFDDDSQVSFKIKKKKLEKILKILLNRIKGNNV